MAKAYSMDLRQRVIADCDAGMGSTAAARKYAVSPAWVRRLKQHRRERGDIAPRHGGHYPRQFDRDRLAQLVQEQPDATLMELRDALGVNVSISAICVALKQLRLTFKKSRSTRRSRTAPTSRRVEPSGVPSN